MERSRDDTDQEPGPPPPEEGEPRQGRSLADVYASLDPGGVPRVDFSRAFPAGSLAHITAQIAETLGQSLKASSANRPLLDNLVRLSKADHDLVGELESRGAISRWVPPEIADDDLITPPSAEQLDQLNDVMGALLTLQQGIVALEPQRDAEAAQRDAEAKRQAGRDRRETRVWQLLSVLLIVTGIVVTVGLAA